MNIINYILDTNYLVLLTTVPLGILGYIFIKSYLNPNQPINEPQTFNFTHEQIKEINEKLERNEELDQETNEKLDQDFENLLGKDEYKNFSNDMKNIQEDFERELQDIFNNFL
jgi:malate synthase